MFCKHMAAHRIPLRQPNNLRCVAYEVKPNLAPLAVAVCLILVDCGGDFLFCSLHRFSFEADGVERTGLHQQDSQFLHRPPIRSLRAAGGTALKLTASEELTPTLLREFVEKIVIHESEALDGKRRGKLRRQEIEIYYSFVGKVELPD